MQKRLFAFIKKKFLCTLCCAENNQPWANAFYYVFDEANHRLIYVTNEKTHHAQTMQSNSQVAGTIFSPTRFVPSLQGIQFTGKATQLTGDDETRMREFYKQTYSHSLIESLSVWEVRLEYIKMIDHTLGFYGKLEWREGDTDNLDYTHSLESHHLATLEKGL